MICIVVDMHVLCMRAAKVQASLRICTVSTEPSLFDIVISVNISCAGIYSHN